MIPVPVRISARSMRQEFNGCEPDYIRDVCHGACCRSTTSPVGTRIALLPPEAERERARGLVVLDGELQPRPGERRCPHQGPEHLCGLHGTGEKPFGCIASPFVLTTRDTLIVRNRYRLLVCYRDGRRLPAYRAFRSSLELLFGTDGYDRIADDLDGGSGDVVGLMDVRTYADLRALSSWHVAEKEQT